MTLGGGLDPAHSLPIPALEISRERYVGIVLTPGMCTVSPFWKHGLLGQSCIVLITTEDD